MKLGGIGTRAKLPVGETIVALAAVWGDSVFIVTAGAIVTAGFGSGIGGFFRAATFFKIYKN